MIEYLTGEEPVLLGEFVEREQLAAVEAIVNKVRRSNESERFDPLQAERKKKIVTILEQLGGGCSSKVLAQCLGLSYSFVKNQRFSLMSGSGIKTEEGVLMPGVSCGRSNLIWHLSEAKLKQPTVYLYLFRSLILEIFFNLKWQPDYFDEKTESVVLKRETIEWRSRWTSFGTRVKLPLMVLPTKLILPLKTTPDRGSPSATSALLRSDSTSSRASSNEKI